MAASRRWTEALTEISRGEVVFEHGTVVGRPGRGRFVKRKPTTSV